MKPEFIHAKDEIWDMFVESRHLFATKAAYGPFIGYADAQLKKMTSFDLETQNRWDYALALIEAAGWTKEQIVKSESRPMPDLDAAADKFVELAVDLTAQQARSVVSAIGIGQYLEDAAKTIHKIHAKHFQGYMGDKRKKLVRRHGYDTKNAAHLIRLMRMCVEFLETGVLNVFRTDDAEELKQIKQGAWTIEQVKAEASALRDRAELAKQESPLPYGPDVDLISHFVVAAHLMAYDLVPNDASLKRAA